MQSAGSGPIDIGDIATWTGAGIALAALFFSVFLYIRGWRSSQQRAKRTDAEPIGLWFVGTGTSRGVFLNNPTNHAIKDLVILLWNADSRLSFARDEVLPPGAQTVLLSSLDMPAAMRADPELRCAIRFTDRRGFCWQLTLGSGLAEAAP